MDLKKLEIKELKAMAYDLSSDIQRLQNNLMAINQEIMTRPEKKDAK